MYVRLTFAVCSVCSLCNSVVEVTLIYGGFFFFVLAVESWLCLG